MLAQCTLNKEDLYNDLKLSQLKHIYEPCHESYSTWQNIGNTKNSSIFRLPISTSEKNTNAKSAVVASAALHIMRQ